MFSQVALRLLWEENFRRQIEQRNGRSLDSIGISLWWQFLSRSLFSDLVRQVV